MKVYILINRLGIPDNLDIIEHIFLHEEDALKMLDSFDDHCSEEYKIEQHEVIE